jgi:hypothetical protein
MQCDLIDRCSMVSKVDIPQFILHSNVYCSFMKAAFRMSGKLSLDEKNAICPPSIRFGDHGRVFDYTRKNIGKGSMTRKCDCKAKLVLLKRDDRGAASNPVVYNDVTIPKIPSLPQA